MLTIGIAANQLFYEAYLHPLSQKRCIHVLISKLSTCPQWTHKPHSRIKCMNRTDEISPTLKKEFLLQKWKIASQKHASYAFGNHAASSIGSCAKTLMGHSNPPCTGRGIYDTMFEVCPMIAVSLLKNSGGIDYTKRIRADDDRCSFSDTLESPSQILIRPWQETLKIKMAHHADWFGSLFGLMKLRKILRKAFQKRSSVRWSAMLDPCELNARRR